VIAAIRAGALECDIERKALNDLVATVLLLIELVAFLAMRAQLKLVRWKIGGKYLSNN
jgi:hypothetical protein